MERNQETENLVNAILEKYPDKKFVIDAGALQMVNPKLLNKNHIITPHIKEMADLGQRATSNQINLDDQKITILLKGPVDKITWYDNQNTPQNKKTAPNKTSPKQTLEIAGGNEGMTKGGTGDVLAGLVAGLYCLNSAPISAIIASKVNKLAGEELYKTVGPFYNASDLVEQVPKTLWQLLQSKSHQN
jgi:NAD(P)H-hydrate repair Nnr-like enzyme with NAD(P)H-hydrate dehydratase domain